MTEWYGYAFLRGRDGAQGYLRGRGMETELCARGLIPLERYALYAGDQLISEEAADGQGALTVVWQGGKDMFLSRGAAVILWPEEEGDIAYYHALESLKKARAREADSIASADAPPVLTDAAEDVLLKETVAEDPAFVYSLRSSGTGEMAWALPALIWPEEIGHLRSLFETRLPFAPLNAPGWRFISLPSPGQGVPFCAAGIRITGCGIAGAAYAVPGSPLRPPLSLSGYAYEPGRNGQGYWVLRKKLKKSEKFSK